MDAPRFARLIHSSPSPRRGLLTRLTSGLLTVVPLASGGDAAAAMKKRKRKKKKQRCAPNCLDRACGNDGCGGSCGSCAATHNCQGGICVCAESPAATCASKPCGTQTNTCGQPVSCPCPNARQCLSNGSCAITCPPACPAHCAGCSNLTTEGVSHCIADAACPNQPVLCASTADCAPGTHCQECAAQTVCMALCAG